MTVDKGIFNALNFDWNFKISNPGIWLRATLMKSLVTWEGCGAVHNDGLNWRKSF